MSGAVATLHYEDEAPPFDLTEMPEKSASTVTIGSLGIELVRGRYQAVRHQRQGCRNITELELPGDS